MLITNGIQVCGASADVDDVHLRARNHQIARPQLGDLQHAFDHRQRIGVEQVAVVSIVQRLQQILAILGLAENEGAQALEQRLVFVRR